MCKSSTHEQMSSAQCSISTLYLMSSLHPKPSSSAASLNLVERFHVLHGNPKPKSRLFSAQCQTIGNVYRMKAGIRARAHERALEQHSSRRGMYSNSAKQVHHKASTRRRKGSIQTKETKRECKKRTALEGAVAVEGSKLKMSVCEASSAWNR